MEMKKQPLIGETTERAVGWRVAAALQGPCFFAPPSPRRGEMVLKNSSKEQKKVPKALVSWFLEHLSATPLLLPIALAFVAYG